jgi:dihydroorotate dehydrogenase
MSTFGSLYKHIFKPVAFAMDPEFVHDRILGLGKVLGKIGLTRGVVASLFDFKHPSLEQDILGIHFPNPIGLAAGFDKNAELTEILPCVGFGFAEVGSITGEASPGNPGKRLWRLPKSQSLLVYYGLKNQGAEVLSRKLSGKSFKFPVGISVAKTNSPDTVERSQGVADYAKAFKLFADIGSYTTINISCPNAFGGQPFTDPESLEALLSEIDKIETKKPVFIKLSPDLGMDRVDELLEVIDRHRVQGIICSNLTKNRQNDNIKDDHIAEVGGMSGKVVEAASNEQIKYIYQKTRGKYIIVGCGGVFTAEDAYKKIKLGASLIQMITGMVYQGPQVIGEINQGLVELLKKDGYKNISEAVGRDN